jgi:formate hydrogenlyase subunit 6/NADH:ubiquinone oxidoreductase subunit I
MGKPGILLPALWKHLVKKPFTVLYPSESWSLPDGYRGIIAHSNEVCIGCGICAKFCPSEAIELVDDPEQKPLGKGRVRKRVPIFFLDRCMRCAQCEELCPQKAIKLQKKVGLVAYHKEDLRIKQ